MSSKCNALVQAKPLHLRWVLHAWKIIELCLKQAPLGSNVELPLSSIWYLLRYQHRSLAGFFEERIVLPTTHRNARIPVNTRKDTRRHRSGENQLTVCLKGLQETCNGLIWFD